MMRKFKSVGLSTLLVSVLSLYDTKTVNAAGNVVNMDINGTAAETLEILMLFTILTLLPSIIIMMTSFTRIVIVLSFVKSGLGLQQTPPNQVLVGLALFLTLFIMSPVLDEVNVTAYQPYKNEDIGQQEFFSRAETPIKEFMLAQTGQKELQLFVDLSADEDVENTDNIEELPLSVVFPSFIISELRRAFIIGFLILIPFLVVDIIVSSVLMSMGMMMLPPAMISLPFKILLFVVVDGWTLLSRVLVMSFN